MYFANSFGSSVESRLHIIEILEFLIFCMDKNTIKLIERYKPMLTSKEIEEFDEFDEPRFDVRIVQRNNEKTIWGDTKEEFFGKTLRELSLEIYDFLDEEYEIWIKDPHLFENEPAKVSEKYIRYIMSLEADNFFEDFTPLKFRLLDGYFVMSLDKENISTKYAQKFFGKFGLEMPDLIAD